MFLGFLVGLFVAAAWTASPRSSTAIVGPARRRRSAAVLISAVGMIDDLRDGVGPGQDRRAWCSPAACSPCSASRCSSSASRSPGIVVAVPGPGAARHRAVGGRHGQRRQPHRRPRRAGRRHRRHRRRAPSSSTATGSPTPGVLGADNIGPLLAVIVLGICLGFLPHNFHPARIFMGDGGALLLGLLMAASTMLVGGQTDDAVQRPDVLLLRCRCSSRSSSSACRSSTPLFAIVRRARKRLSLAEADKEHLHHRLMRLGHGQRRSVLILWAWTALLSGFVLYPIYTDGRATPSCRSGWPPSAWCCTPSSTPASGGPAAQRDRPEPHHLRTQVFRHGSARFDLRGSKPLF